MKTGILIAVILLASVLAQAKNFAFVMAGSNVPGANELIMETAAASLCLKDSGYDVRTLIGADDPATSQMDNESSFPEDYKFLKDNADKITRLPANVQSIEKQMTKLVDDVKAERAKGEPVKVEIIINAHGKTNCLAKDLDDGFNLPPYGKTSAQALQLRPPAVSDCKHQVQVFDGQKMVQMNTRTLSTYLKALEAAGAEVNLNLNSCSSGVARKDFDGLKNTCTYYASPDQAFGTGCDGKTEADIKNKMWNSNTYVNMFRSCAGKFDKLKDQAKYGNYFTGNRCFMGLANHIKENKIDLSSVGATYFSERPVSTSFESSLLSCYDEEFVTQSGIAAHLYQNQTICVEDEVKKVEKLVGPITDTIIKDALDKYTTAIKAYNKNIEEQDSLVQIDIPLEEYPKETQERFKSLQQQAEGLGLEMIRHERTLFERFRELHPEKFKACETGPCGRKSP